MRGRAAHMGSDQVGAALVEFALLAPVMVLMFFGAIEAVQAVQAHRRLAHVSAAIGDVVAQEGKLSPAELEDILAAGPALMAPFSGAGLGERVMSFSADDDGRIRLNWQAARSAYAGEAPVGLPAGSLDPGESVIVTDVSYEYSPVFNLPFSRPLSFQKRTLHRPRLTRQVTLE